MVAAFCHSHVMTSSVHVDSMVTILYRQVARHMRLVGVRVVIIVLLHAMYFKAAYAFLKRNDTP